MGNMERKIVLGWGLTLAIVIFVAVYWLNEPQRMAMASEEFRLEAVQRGAELYAEHCASCHGDEGQGIPNVGSPLNSRAFLEMYDDEAIGAAIYDGRPNTLMTAYAQAKGGPLRDNQIEDLVAFIRNWEAMAPLLPTPTPVIDPASLYAQYCAGCHGPNGEGTDAISLPLNSKGFLERTDDATLYRLIAQGRPEQGMPTFAGELSKAEINALVSFVRAWEATAPELAPGGATLYARYCAFCHGANGEGVKNVPVVLNSKEFLSTHDDAYLRQVIAEGHEDMPPWSLTMTEGEIERLVGFIRAWEEMAPEEEGGEALYARHCAFCHGPQGEGAPNVPIVLSSEEFLATHDDAYLHQAISQGHEDMPPWGKEHGGILRKDQIDDLVQFIRGWAGEIAVAAPPDGAALYAEHCALCHGAAGEGGFGIALNDKEYLASKDDAYFWEKIGKGVPGKMAAFKDKLTPAEIEAIIAFMRKW